MSSQFSPVWVPWMRDAEGVRNVVDMLMDNFGTIASMETNAGPWDITAVEAIETVIAAKRIVK